MSLKTNLIRFFKLDGNANDAVGAGNGTNNGGVFSAANGIIVQGVGVNGSSTYVDSGYSPAFGTSDFSISIWFKTSTSQKNKWILGEYDNNSSQNYCIISIVQDVKEDNSNKVGFFCRGSTFGSEIQINVSDGAINDGNWHHCGMSIDRTNNKLYGYYDGSLKINQSITFLGSFSNSRTIYLGATNAGGGSNYWAGAIDEVGFWTRVLTPTEWSKLYKNGTGFPYPFSEGINTNWFL